MWRLPGACRAKAALYLCTSSIIASELFQFGVSLAVVVEAEAWPRPGKLAWKKQPCPTRTVASTRAYSNLRELPTLRDWARDLFLQGVDNIGVKTTSVSIS